ncbi:MAG: hypothetical protein AAF456_04450 [Planctomycetota bacterium]
MKRLEQLHLQRLIDGRLDDREISEIVRDAQDHPELWQQIGSAFVEDRVFRTAIGLFGEEPLQNSSPVELAKKSDPPAAQTNRLRAGSALAIAASLLVALTAGLVAGWYMNRGTNETRLAAPSPENRADEMLADNSPDNDQLTATPQMNQVVDVQPDYHLQLQNADGNEMLTSEVPLYTFNNAKRIGYTFDQNNLPDEAYSIAVNSGYGLDERIDYMSGVLSDGRRFIVPIRTLKLSHGQ